MAEPRGGVAAEVGAFVRDIKLEHSLFALPFALLGLLLAMAHEWAGGRRPSPWPSGAELLWFTLAMVGARTAAMGFNRLVDRRLDARNPRTQNRALAAGRARPEIYALLILTGVLVLLESARQFNPLALWLAPVALLALFGYSFTKRFTVLCHYFVGLALGIAPLAAWVAATGRLPDAAAPWWLALAVLCWVGGFDIIYATMDIEFDRDAGLHSLPARFGVEPALAMARVSHLITVLALLAVGLTAPPLGPAFLTGVAAAAALLAYEHAIVSPDDLGRVNTAFFTVNGVLGLVILLAGLVDLWRHAG